MPWMINPFTGRFTYYERGIPAGGEEGQVLRKTSGETADYAWTQETLLADVFKSKPPEGAYRVTNIYVDPSTSRLFIEYDDVPGGEGYPTAPPQGTCKVTNLWVDPQTGKLTVEYDDIPA